MLRLAGSRGSWKCGILELIQAVGAFVNECGTEVVLEEGDGEDDAHDETDGELDPEEEREGPDEATIANDRTDVTNRLWIQYGGRTRRSRTKCSPEDADESKDSPDDTSNDESSLKTTLDSEPKFGTWKSQVSSD